MSRFPYRYIVAVAFLFGLFMDLMDLTIVNVALPTLGREFNIGHSTLEWIVTGYLLSLAVWIPASGWIGDKVGTKKTFIFALAAFCVGSALCGFAQGGEQLVAFRIIQGIGGGMMTPVGTAMLFRAFPPAERARAALILTIPTVVAPAVGPVLGGYLVDYVNWRWIFFVNLPIGVVGLVFSALFLEEHTEPTAGGFDLPGFALSASGLALVLYSLSRGPEAGWGTLEVLGTGIVGVVAFAALIWVELHTAQPMLDLRLYKDRMFRSASIVFFIASASLIGAFFLLTLFLQELRGLSAIQTGLILLPQAVTVVMFAQVSGRLYPKVGPKRLLAFALLLFAISSGVMVWVDIDTPIWMIIGILCLRGVAMAFTFIPLQAAAFARIAPPSIGRASSLFNTDRQVGSSIGVALLATVLSERLIAHAPQTAAIAAAKAGATPALAKAAAVQASVSAFHEAFLAAFVLALVGVVLTLLIHDEDAASTLHAPASAAVAE
ncbi:MAG: DHA2 family efflux MFS transporter permease subunit [Chloroflexi bacterium]|nr:MAG: DHA2 family efflux MFS transporter permease subunit [Chloroflexota bacterium]